jgi:hypothetical protein
MRTWPPIEVFDDAGSPAPAGDPPTSHSRGAGSLASASRAVAYGTSAALLAAAAYAASVILTGYETGIAATAVGIAVAYAVSAGAGSLGPGWRRLISVMLTFVGLAAGEYVIARHLGDLTRSTLLLSPSDVTALVRADLKANPLTLMFWGIALLSASTLSTHGHLRIGRSRNDSHAVAPDVVTAPGKARRLDRWAPSLAASVALALGAGGLLCLSRVPLGTSSAERPSIPVHASTTTPVPLEAVRVGDCFNNPTTESIDSLPELPCEQPHDLEVFDIYAMKAGAYPGDEQVYQSALDACQIHLSSYVAKSDLGALDTDALTPERDTWNHGDRSVFCSLYRVDNTKITGTAGEPR